MTAWCRNATLSGTGADAVRLATSVPEAVAAPPSPDPSTTSMAASVTTWLRTGSP
jgi:hypothetical protein